MKYRSVDSFWYKFFNSKLILGTLMVLVMLIFYSVIKEGRVQRETGRELKSLEDEIAELEGQSLELAEMIKYLRSDEFVEREAREKLNMQRPGEKVVLIPEKEKLLTQVAGDANRQDRKNWQLWFEYFFNK